MEMKSESKKVFWRVGVITFQKNIDIEIVPFLSQLGIKFMKSLLSLKQKQVKANFDEILLARCVVTNDIR